MPSEPVDQERVDLLREAGISVSEADAQRVSVSVRNSLSALQSAVSGSLFDTEPQTFDVTLRKLSKGGGHE